MLKKTNVISVSYESHDPKTAQKVLATLDEAYLQKHLDVHHPTGQFEFFDQQADKYKQDMLSAEAQLKQFAGSQNGVAPSTMRDMTLQKLADFSSSLETTKASIAETEHRIADLEKQSHSTPSRLTTQMKKGDNAQVLENLKATLLTLEMKRTELLTKYQPTYPLVQEVDKQLTDTRAGAGEGRRVAGEGRSHRPESHVRLGQRRTGQGKGGPERIPGSSASPEQHHHDLQRAIAQAGRAGHSARRPDAAVEGGRSQLHAVHEEERRSPHRRRAGPDAAVERLGGADADAAQYPDAVSADLRSRRGVFWPRPSAWAWCSRSTMRTSRSALRRRF